MAQPAPGWRKRHFRCEMLATSGMARALRGLLWWNIGFSSERGKGKVKSEAGWSLSTIVRAVGWSQATPFSWGPLAQPLYTRGAAERAPWVSSPGNLGLLLPLPSAISGWPPGTLRPPFRKAPLLFLCSHLPSLLQVSSWDPEAHCRSSWQKAVPLDDLNWKPM